MQRRGELLAWIGSIIGKPPGWERVVRRLVPPEKCAGLPDLRVERDGTHFLAQPYVNLGWHVIYFWSYEPELRRLFAQALPPGGIAVDVGANVGWHSLLMARLVGPQGRVFAAEANPSIRKRLMDNLALNYFDQVQVIPYAIGDSETTVAFHAPDATALGSGSGHVVAGDASVPSDTIRVETRRLDSILAAADCQRLDLVKIDVEGHEWPVLRGAEASISRFRPHIVFEYDANYVSRGGADPAAFAGFFRRHGYRLFAVTRKRLEPLGLANWPSSANIWAAPLDPA